MSFVGAAHLALLAVTVAVATISAGYMLASIREGDVIFAWAFAVLFVVCSFLFAWYSWRLL